MNLKEFFLLNPIFSFKDFIEASECTHNTARNKLSYHVKHGHINRIKKGLYASIPYGENVLNYQINPYLIAGLLTDDAVISYHCALAYYGCSYSTIPILTILTKHDIREQVFQGQIFRGIQHPKSLLSDGNHNNYVNSEDIQGKIIRITSIERTFVDILDRPDLGGGWEEVIRAIDMIERLNIEKVINYTSLLDNKTTSAKVGYFLEKNAAKFHVSKKQLNILARNLPYAPHYIDRKGKDNKFISNWNILLPDKIYNETWNEKLL